MTTELLSQLTAVIATAETNRVDAERWYRLITLLGDLGYGPRITPEQIAELVPNIHGLQELSATTQEVVPAQPAGSKMPRRKLTSEDERVITARSDAGCPAAQIAEDLGIAQKIVRDFLDRTHA
jgi:DNA-binding NarL/FixJ family response regulator